MTIKITVDVATDIITLYNKGLKVLDMKVTDRNNDELEKTVKMNKAKDFLIINVERLLNVGDEYTYTLEISFNGFRYIYRNKWILYDGV